MSWRSSTDVPPSSGLVSSTGAVLAADARHLTGFFERGRGWLGRVPDPNLALAIPLSEGERLHSLGMRVPLDVAYCAADGRIIQVLTLPPWRIAPAVPGARLAWELLGGRLDGVAVGEVLRCA